jgi:hypothetical protein
MLLTEAILKGYVPALCNHFHSDLGETRENDAHAGQVRHWIEIRSPDSRVLARPRYKWPRVGGSTTQNTEKFAPMHARSQGSDFGYCNRINWTPERT